MWGYRILFAHSSKDGHFRKASALAAAALATSSLAYVDLSKNNSKFQGEDNNNECSSKCHEQIIEKVLSKFKWYNNFYHHSDSCQCESLLKTKPSNIQRRSTLRRLNENSQPIYSLNAKYNVSWDKPIGEGAFSTVYKAANRSTHERVAIKKIPKLFTDSTSFQNEIDALLYILENGGHPHICSLNESFEDNKNFYLVLDLVSGGEMFDHLIKLGAYSEADAARLIREAAMALCFIHGIGIVHGDLKPENLMLSTDRSQDGSVKLVDFGCAYIISEEEEENNDQVDQSVVEKKIIGGNTPAYCPPEALVRTNVDPLSPSMDMWSLGIILYIMLTGLHPFDMNGNCTDEEIECRIKSKQPPPLRNSPITAHLSDSAIDVIEKCISWDPNDRITAQELLEHPWVRGDTANESKMSDASKKLKMYQPYKSKLEAKVFADFFSWSNDDQKAVSKKSSLIERAFNSIDVNNQGFLTSDDLKRTFSKQPEDISQEGIENKNQQQQKPMSLSGFSDLLGENMKNRYFPRGCTIYKEGDIGNHMYFINSGIIEVTTKDGSRALRRQGDFFGEGALLHPKKIRSASIHCLTPVHAIEISREYFEKYVASSGLNIDLKEKDRTRKRNRAKTILRLQKNLKTLNLSQGYTIFKEGEEAEALYILEKGLVCVYVDGKKVFEVKPGDIFGEHSMIMGRPRNTTATCLSEECIAQEMKARDFYELYNSSSSLKSSLRELCLRREFQKSLVKKTKKEFPSINDLREVFDAADKNKSGFLCETEVAALLTSFDPSLSKEEIKEVVNTLDLDETGRISFDEFKLIFGMNEARASSI